MQGHRSARKQKTSAPIGWNLVFCWNLFVWWTSYSFDLVHLIFKGENLTCDFVRKKNPFNVIFRHLQTDFFQIWDDDRDYYVLHLYIHQFGWPWPSFKVSVVWETKNASIFSETSQSIWIKFSLLPQPVWLKLMVNLFCANNIQGRQLCWCNVIKCIVNIIMYWNGCELICFKLGIMLDMIKLYTLFQFEWPCCLPKVIGLWEI